MNLQFLLQKWTFEDKEFLIQEICGDEWRGYCGSGVKWQSWQWEKNIFSLDSMNDMVDIDKQNVQYYLLLDSVMKNV